MAQPHHLSAEVIARFPSLPRRERASFFAHARECRHCGAAFLAAWQIQTEPAPPPQRILDVSSVLDRVAQSEAQLRRERANAVELTRELMHHPHARRQTLVRNSRRFSNWGLCEALLAQAKDAGYDDPRVAVEQAELAVEISQRLDGEVYGETLVHDFRARANAGLGQARLALDDLRGSYEAFELAAIELALGSGDPLEQAQLAYLRGTLYGAQRRFIVAFREFDKAISIYARVGDRHLQAKAFVAKGAALAKAGQPEESIQLQQRALEMLDATREPRVLLAARHNLLADLVDCGRTEEALRMLDGVRQLHEGAGERINRLRLDWIEGQLRQQVGDHEEAESLFVGLRAEFCELGMAYDVALVSLELAALYVEQSRAAEIKRLAMEMLPLFKSLDIQRETIAALMLFRQAAETQSVTLTLIQSLAAFVKRAQNDPTASFAPAN